MGKSTYATRGDRSKRTYAYDGRMGGGGQVFAVLMRTW